MEKISRRDFLKYVGAGGVGTGAGILLGESAKKTVELLIPQVVPPEDYSPGIATWYNTVCRQCSAGCGISVRTREGRAKKIEGNPVHPVNQGRLCALGQAGLNALYNPDRIRTPLKRTGERGSNSYQAISWDEALTTLGSRLGNLKIQEKAGHIYLLTDGVRGHLDKLFATFMQALGSNNYLKYDFTYPVNHYLANKLSFDEEILPYYDIKNTAYLLSFGADYLGTWMSPVHYSLSYGHLRQGKDRPRGKCIQIEPRMSLTGANADEWIQAQPGTEGLLALAIAHVIVNNGYYNGEDQSNWRQVLKPYDPGTISRKTGVAKTRIVGIANEFATSKTSLAIGGGSVAASTNAVSNLIAINTLNYLAGNLGQKGGIIFNPEPVFSSGTQQHHANFNRMRELTNAMTNKEVEVLILNHTNPAFTLPTALQFRNNLTNVPTIVSLSSFMDETTVMADLILPTDTYLEAWGDDIPEPGVGFSIASVSQPVVKRLYDTRSSGDIILALAHQIGSEVTVALPWADMESYLKTSWQEVYQKYKPVSDQADFETFWNYALSSGVWGEDKQPREKSIKQIGQSLINEINGKEPTFTGTEKEYPFYLHPYLTQTFYDGRGANLPWMQELPDPMTSVVYGSWIELNPTTASKMGISEGDVLEVKSKAGSIKAPAFIFPAIRPDVIAMPIGQGHTQFGRYAKDRGANPLQILAPEVDDKSGAHAWAATRVTIKKTGKRINIIKTDGVTRTLGRQIFDDHSKHKKPGITHG